MDTTPDGTVAETVIRPAPELRGHGLLLTSWDPERDADVEAWLRGHTDPDFTRWNTPLRPVTCLDDARGALRRMAGREADGTCVAFRVTDEESGRALGALSFNMIDHLLSNARIGYWVLPEARGRGVASGALRLGTRWAFSGLGLHRLELGHAVGHEASCRVAEKCGFLAEGILRGEMFAEGRRDAFRDAHLHARLATDPEPPAAARESA